MIRRPSLSDAYLARDIGRELRGGGYRRVFKLVGDSWVYKFNRKSCDRRMGNNAEIKVYNRLKMLSLPPRLHLPEVVDLGSGVLAMQFIRGRLGHDDSTWSPSAVCNCWDRLDTCWIDIVESWDGMIDVHGGNVKIDTQGRIWLIDLGEPIES